MHQIMFVGRSSQEIVRRYGRRLRRLREEGFEVSVFAADDGAVDALVAEGLRFQGLPVKNPRNPAGLLAAYLILQGAFLEDRPILVHVFSHRLAWLTAFAAREAGVEAVVTTMDYHWVEQKPVHFPRASILGGRGKETVRSAEMVLNRLLGPVARKSMADRYRWLGEQVDRYVVTSQFDRQLLADLDLVENAKVVCQLGGAGVRVHPGSREAKGLAGEKLPERWRQVFGWVGPLSGRHGGEDLLAAIHAFSSSHPSLGWLIALRGERWGGLEARLRRMERKGWVKIVQDPTLEEERAILESLDAYVWVGTPATPVDPVLEAAAAGVPTLGYETTTVREVIRNGETGLLVLEEDRAALLDVLRVALGDPVRVKEMGARGGRDMALRFSREDRDEEMLQLYAALLREKTGAGPMSRL